MPASASAEPGWPALNQGGRGLGPAFASAPCDAKFRIAVAGTLRPWISLACSRTGSWIGEPRWLPLSCSSQSVSHISLAAARPHPASPGRVSATVVGQGCDWRAALTPRPAALRPTALVSQKYDRRSQTRKKRTLKLRPHLATSRHVSLLRSLWLCGFPCYARLTGKSASPVSVARALALFF